MLQRDRPEGCRKPRYFREVVRRLGLRCLLDTRHGSVGVVGDRPYNPERFRELLLYIADRMARTDHWGRGRIKLAKLIWLSDFEAYLKLGRSITGAEYHRDKLGPSPRAELLEARAFNPETEFAYERVWDKQKLPVAKRPANTDLFDERELALVNEVVDRYRSWTGDDLVHKVAHKHPGYEMVKHGELVPYESVFVSTKPPSEATVAKARELVGGQPRDDDIPF